VTPSTEIAVLIYYILCFYFLSADLDSARISLRAVLSALEPGPCLWQHLLPTPGVKMRLEPPSRTDILQQAYKETREWMEELDARLSWASVEDSATPLHVPINGQTLYRHRTQNAGNEDLACSGTHQRWAFRSLPLVTKDEMVGLLFATIQEDRAQGQAAVAESIRARYVGVNRDRIRVALDLWKKYRLGALKAMGWRTWNDE